MGRASEGARGAVKREARPGVVVGPLKWEGLGDAHQRLEKHAENQTSKEEVWWRQAGNGLRCEHRERNAYGKKRKEKKGKGTDRKERRTCQSGVASCKSCLLARKQTSREVSCFWLGFLRKL
mmetsp:Transcript_42286/g.91341  ORF Transcript_42286/g.91341 Transcript_42286/m.91341 type:complete len:122 (-) Transcript_42286:53-418(-)